MSLYFLFHLPSQNQSNNLSIEELIAKTQDDSNLDNWMCWRPGMATWSIIKDCEEVIAILKSKNSEKLIPPPLPPSALKKMEPAIKEDDEFIIIDYTTSDPQSTSSQEPEPTPVKSPNYTEKRTFPRIKCRWRTVITNKEKAFLTYTRDISMGGVQLENSIPEDLLKSESVDIFITGPSGKESLLFECKPIPGQSLYYRFSFPSKENKNQSKLSEWLLTLGK